MHEVPSGSVSEIILEGLDNAWTPLLDRLSGISEGEYPWEPTSNCWTVRPGCGGPMIADWADPDPAPPLQSRRRPRPVAGRGGRASSSHRQRDRNPVLHA